jgi:hypothetical protein
MFGYGFNWWGCSFIAIVFIGGIIATCLFVHDDEEVE